MLFGDFSILSKLNRYLRSVLQGIHQAVIVVDGNFIDHSVPELIEVEDEALWVARGGDEITKKWWDYMADIMETNSDNSPYSRKINEVFHLD